MANLTTSDQILTILEQGDLDLSGRFLWGSNSTFLVSIVHKDHTLPAVYKPSQGETPLWDFPRGSLAQREVAAYLVCESLGWNLIPPTILREDAPAGPGSLQQYVDADPEHHYFNFSEDEKQLLRPVALFDLLANNADRKGGHILIHPEGGVFLIDHGLCFHAEPKLRTVVWDFVGEPIPDALLVDVERLQEQLCEDAPLYVELASLLAAEELAALCRRMEALLETPVFPGPGPGRPYPWPLV